MGLGLRLRSRTQCLTFMPETFFLAPRAPPVVQNKLGRGKRQLAGPTRKEQAGKGASGN